MSGAALFKHRDVFVGVPKENDLIKLTDAYWGCNIDFENIALMPGSIAVVLSNPCATPFGLVYEVLCAGEICIDVPAHVIEFSTAV